MFDTELEYINRIKELESELDELQMETVDTEEFLYGFLLDESRDNSRLSKVYDKWSCKPYSDEDYTLVNFIGDVIYNIR